MPRAHQAHQALRRGRAACVAYRAFARRCGRSGCSHVHQVGARTWAHAHGRTRGSRAGAMAAMAGRRKSPASKYDVLRRPVAPGALARYRPSLCAWSGRRAERLPPGRSPSSHHALPPPCASRRPVPARTPPDAGKRAAALWLPAAACAPQARGRSPPSHQSQAGLSPLSSRGLDGASKQAQTGDGDTASGPSAAMATRRGVGDGLHAGYLGRRRRFRTLNILDIVSRQCLAIEVYTSLPGQRVARVLNQLMAWCGAPRQITIDNGPEFAGQVLDAWGYAHSVSLEFIEPGKPSQNGDIESFNGKFRDACLTVH